MGAAAAEPFELVLLQDTEEFGLQRRRNVAHFVEEQRASVGQLEPAHLLGNRTGKRSLFMTEQLALEQVERDGGTIEFHERPAASELSCWIARADQLLAGAAFAVDQDGSIGRRDALDLVEHSFQRRTTADDLLEPGIIGTPLVVLGCIDSLHSDPRTPCSQFTAPAPLARCRATPRRQRVSPETRRRLLVAPASAFVHRHGR